MLARFGEQVRPAPQPDRTTQALDALLTRRRQLITLRTAETNRLDLVPRAVQADRRGRCSRF